MDCRHCDSDMEWRVGSRRHTPSEVTHILFREGQSCRLRNISWPWGAFLFTKKTIICNRTTLGIYSKGLTLIRLRRKISEILENRYWNEERNILWLYRNGQLAAIIVYLLFRGKEDVFSPCFWNPCLLEITLGRTCANHKLRSCKQQGSPKLKFPSQSYNYYEELESVWWHR